MTGAMMTTSNTAGRAFWVIWCCAWAGLWATLAVVTMTSPTANHLALLGLAVASLAAIALPVGRKGKVKAGSNP